MCYVTNLLTYIYIYIYSYIVVWIIQSLIYYMIIKFSKFALNELKDDLSSELPRLPLPRLPLSVLEPYKQWRHWKPSISTNKYMYNQWLKSMVKRSLVCSSYGARKVISNKAIIDISFQHPIPESLSLYNLNNFNSVL